jgi:adenine/guanine phosphoribosyltransferase-like PRPP-binding protein
MLSVQKFTRADRLVDASWRAVTWMLIASIGGASLVLLYFAMMLGFSGKWDAITLPAAGGIALAFAVALLCRYRSDLVGE